MPTISVRTTEEENKKLLRYGPLSNTAREALDLYMRDKKSREFIQKLRKFQRENPVKVDPDEIVKIIREGRKR